MKRCRTLSVFNGRRRLATRRSCIAAVAIGVVMLGVTPARSSAPPLPDQLLLKGTVVTMDAAHNVLKDGRVLVSGGKIQRVWTGNNPPGVSVRGVPTVDEAPAG